MNAKAPRAGCLSRGDIVALLDGSLPSIAHASAHLGECRDCQAAVDEVSRVPDIDRRLADWSQGERHRFAPRPGFVPVDLGTPVPPDLTGPPATACYDSAPPTGFETVVPAGLPAGPATRTLGKYRLLRLLGEGGMGRVWEAEDTELHRRVALKEVRPEFGDSPAIHDRFLREARMLAGISHDHVVVIYDAGRAEDELFIVMELLDGEPLDRFLTRVGPLPIVEAVRIAREAALGLAQLHARGLVHRDVKPGNLFLQGPGGRVKLLDLGLARPAEAEPGFTRSGAVVGTPNYMSPEQAAGKPVDARTDLFSLGCVLHHALTGKTPFKGETPMVVMSSVLRDDPVPVSGLRPDTPPALADLVRRLLSKDPKGRPATAAEVAEELARIKPRRPRSWVTTALAAAALLLGLALSALVVIKITHKDGKQTTLKVPPGTEVEVDKNGEIKVKLPDGGKEQAKDGKEGKEPVKKGDPPTPPAARPSAILGDPADKSRGRVNSLAFSPDGSRLLAGTNDGHVRWWDVAARKEAWSRQALDLGHETFVVAALSPDGKRVFSAGTHMRLKLWEVGGEAPAAVMGLEPAREYVLCPPAFLPDGKHVLAAHRDYHEGPSTVRLWDLEGKREVRTFKVPRYVRTVSIEPNGKRFVTAGDDGVFRLWDVVSGKLLARTPDKGEEKVNLAAWSPAGPFVLAGAYTFAGPPGPKRAHNGAIMIWELVGDEPKLRASYALPGTFPTRAAWSRDGGRLAYSTADGRLLVRAFPSGDLLGEWSVPDVGALAFSPSGGLAVGTGAAIALLDLPPAISTSGRRDWQPKEHIATLGKVDESGKSAVASLSYTADGGRLLAGGNDGYARLWEPSTGKLLSTIEARRGSPAQAAISPDGRLAVLAGHHMQVRVWDVKADKEVTSFGRGAALEVVFSKPVFLPGGKGVFLAHRVAHGKGTTVTLYDTGKFAAVASFAHERYVTDLAVSPDGKRLATVAEDGRIRLWDVASGKKTTESFLPGNATCIAWSPAGPRILMGIAARGADRATIQEWDADADAGIIRRAQSDAQPTALAWAPDGKGFAFADQSGRVSVHGMPGGEMYWDLPKPALSLAFAPDGKSLAVGTSVGTVLLLRLPPAIPVAERREWQPKELLAILGTHTKERDETQVESLAFTKDGSRLLSGGRDGYARLWDVATGKGLAAYLNQTGAGVRAAVSPDARFLVLAGQRVRVRDLEADKELGTFGPGDDTALVLGDPLFLPDGKGFFLAHRDGHKMGTTVRLYDAATREERARFPHPKAADDESVPNRYVSGMAVSPDGKRLFTAAEDGGVRLWDVTSGKKLDEVTLPAANGASVVRWSPDGGRLLVGIYARTGHPDTKAGKARNAIQAWEIKGDKLKLADDHPDLAGHPVALALSADGKTAAFADDTGRVGVRTLPSWGKVADWTMPGVVSSLALTTDGRTLAIGTRWGAVYLVRVPGR